jgi:hypothetical protein
MLMNHIAKHRHWSKNTNRCMHTVYMISFLFWAFKHLSLYHPAHWIFVTNVSAIPEENTYQHCSKRAQDALTETVPNHQKICFWSSHLYPTNMTYPLWQRWPEKVQTRCTDQIHARCSNPGSLSSVTVIYVSCSQLTDTNILRIINSST